MHVNANKCIVYTTGHSNTIVQGKQQSPVVEAGGRQRRSKPPKIEHDSSISGVEGGEVARGSAIPKIERDGSISGVVEDSGVAREMISNPRNRARQLDFGGC